ncbi:MAG: HepT-like ribonuclease domain-containing protein [Thermomicrobiales bacterium]
MVQDAILMRLQVIGESLANMRQINEEAFLAMGDNSWSEIIGLRNIISHGYVTITMERIWDFLAEDLTAFADSIESANTRLQ